MLFEGQLEKAQNCQYFISKYSKFFFRHVAYHDNDKHFEAPCK